jgi:uncharacterized protein YjgD (DUF1641 family)
MPADGTTADDRLLAALARIDERLARLEAENAELRALAERAAEAASQAPRALAIATDVFDDTVRGLASRGVDVDARARDALVLVERLTAPDTMRALGDALSLVDNLPKLAATATDVLDGAAARAIDQGIDIDQRMRILLRCTERLTSPEALGALELMLSRVDSLRSVLESGVLDEAPVRLVGKAGVAMAEVAAEGAPPAGPFGAMLAMGRSDVQRSLGLLLKFAERFGRALDDGDEKRLPATRGSTNGGQALAVRGNA